MTQKLMINILTDKTSWMNLYDKKLINLLSSKGHNINIVYSKHDLKEADISFLLSCFEIIGTEFLKLSKHNIVVHASDLPKGKGWSPSSWQILAGQNDIPISLFEATDAVDAGDIYIKDKISLQGHELIDEWQDILGNKIVSMCCQFIDNYPSILNQKVKQSGAESFYRRRTPKDSQLDINKSIKEQFNLFRIVDNNKYPAYFDFNGHRYILKIFEDKNDK